MKALLLVKPGMEHQIDAMTVLAQGLATHGIQAEITHAYPPCPVVPGEWDFIACWGDKIVTDIPRLILEAGYINGQSGDYVRDRLQFVSAGWNGLHGRADVGRLGCPPDRWEKLNMCFLPWRNDNDKYALVCDQHPGDSCAPGDARWWNHIADHYAGRREVVYRPHPLLADEQLLPLAQSLDRAGVCFTWNSTCAIEAVILGVPTWALDRGSSAWDVTAHQVGDDPYLGAREQWAYDLAYRQWTHEELASGEAWETLQHGIEE